MADQFDARALIHKPDDMMAEVIEWAEGIHADPGIKFGIPAIDSKVIPMRPGNLVCFIARPGHAKTSLLVYLARQEAQRIIDRGTQDTEAVIYTTWEQTAEELTAMMLAEVGFSYSDIAWGRVDIEDFKRRVITGKKYPLYIIGHGISRAGLKVPRMTPDIVLAAIESMQEDQGVKPTMMLFDYLQLIPTRVAKDRVQQVTEMPILLKELAMRVGAPAVAAVQASREVDSRKPPIPEMNDAQWASSIEQTADKIFSCFRPIRVMDENSFIEMGDQRYTVTQNLMVIKMLKQRGDVGTHTWAMYFDPSVMHLAELETRYENTGTEYLHDH
jgi:replicative DNA helicase